MTKHIGYEETTMAKKVELEAKTNLESNALVPLCAVCASPLSGHSQKCTRCELDYHSDCWEYNGRCAIYGCGGQPRRTYFVEKVELRVARYQQELNETRSWQRVNRRLGLTLLGIGLFSPLGLVLSVPPIVGSWFDAKRIGELEKKLIEYRESGHWIERDQNGNSIEYLPNGSVILIPCTGGR